VTLLSAHYIQIDGHQLATYANGLEAVDGIETIPGRRIREQPAAYVDGSYPSLTTPSFFGPKRQRLRIWVSATDVNGAVTHTTGPAGHLQENLEALKRILGGKAISNHEVDWIVPNITVVYSLHTTATAGTLTLSDGVDTTLAIAFDALAATVETRLETDITSITDVSVTGTGTSGDPWIITFLTPAFGITLTADGALLTPVDSETLTQIQATRTLRNEARIILPTSSAGSSRLIRRFPITLDYPWPFFRDITAGEKTLGPFTGAQSFTPLGSAPLADATLICTAVGKIIHTQTGDEVEITSLDGATEITIIQKPPKSVKKTAGGSGDARAFYNSNRPWGLRFDAGALANLTITGTWTIKYFESEH